MPSVPSCLGSLCLLLGKRQLLHKPSVLERLQPKRPADHIWRQNPACKHSELRRCFHKLPKPGYPDPDPNTSKPAQMREHIRVHVCTCIPTHTCVSPYIYIYMRNIHIYIYTHPYVYAYIQPFLFYTRASVRAWSQQWAQEETPWTSWHLPR